jgi:uncharacterized damage-inducible protein DinB
MLSERDIILLRIEDLRAQVSSLIADLPVSALDWRPIEPIEGHAANSLAVLAAHIVGAERFWIGQVVGGGPATRDRDAEFATRGTSASELLRRIEAAGTETRAVLSSLQPDDLDGTRDLEGRAVPVRWALLHVVDHTSLHLGHMQITYQLWAGGRSRPSPRWSERLPFDEG